MKAFVVSLVLLIGTSVLTVHGEEPFWRSADSSKTPAATLGMPRATLGAPRPAGSGDAPAPYAEMLKPIARARLGR